MSTAASAAQDEPFFLPAELEEIRRAFFDQGREALDGLDQGLLAIEGQLPTPDRLRSLRRAAHTLKSDFATVGYPGLSSLSHALEDALSELERHARPVSARDVDRLLAAVDALRRGLEAGAREQPEPDVAPWVAALAHAGDAAPDVEHALREGRRQGRLALRLTLHWRGRRRAEKVLARAVDALALEVLASGPLAPSEGGTGLWLAALSSLDADELERRAQALRGVSAVVELRQSSSLPEAPSLPSAEGATEGETLRLDSSRVDEVLRLVGEMVIARAAIAAVSAETETWLPDELATRLADALARAGRVLQDLQRSAMRMRMVPAERVFRRFGRTLRDLRQRTGKPLVLRVEGEQTELDRGILDALEEPLLHLVRNAADHGIEPATARAEAGKPAEGHILLRASREGNQVVVEVGDDGRGIDAEAVRAQAVQAGLLSAEAAAALDESAAQQLVFLPGLSTAREITETSGRGIGLDVVRETVEALKGTVLAISRPGQGTSVVLRVPLTVAIIRALLFRAGGRELAVPLSSVAEIARHDDSTTEWVGARELLRVRDEILPLVRPADVLGAAVGHGPGGFVLVAQCALGRFALLVDELVGEQELVIKAVHDRWIRTPLVAGAAVLAGGGLVLILDVAAVQRSLAGAGS